MGLYFHLAWRNLWRNRRRTLISTSSVFFAVILALGMRSMQNGTYDYMVQTAVKLYLGYIQIHGDGYWETRSLDQSITITDSVLQSLANIPLVTQVVPRFEAFTLVSKDSSTKIAQVVGIDPNRENTMTGLAGRVQAGRYLRLGEPGMLIGSGLARLLKAGIGDSIVIYGQGFHGVTAAASVPVIGIVKFPLPDLDNSMSYLTLPYAQWLFSAPGRLTSVAFMIRSPSDLEEAQADILERVGPATEVLTWKEMMPELVQAIQADSAGGALMLLILYIVIGFGIFGTIMMMTSERTREFGVLLSIGMKRWRLIAVTTIETALITLLGAACGIAAGIPILWYLHLYPIRLTGELAEVMLAYGMEPVLPFSVTPGIFVAQTFVIFILGIVCAIYPFLVIQKLNPDRALRS